MMASSDRNVKRFHLVLDQDVVLLAREKLHETRGNDNVSQFVNELLEEFVLNERKDPDPIRQEIKELAERKKREIRSQRKLIQDEEAVRQEILGHQTRRAVAIEHAAVQVFLSRRNFSRCLPENDPDHDHVDEFDHAISEISRLAGYDVDPAEVIRIYRQKTRTKYTGTREVEALADGVPFCDEEDERPHGLGDYLYRRNLS